MERGFVFVGIFVLLIGFCVAADGWGDINVEGGGDSLNESGVVVDEGYSGYSDDVDYSSEVKTFFTLDFYIAIGLGVLVLIIIGIFIWFFLKGPRNKWEK